MIMALVVLATIASATHCKMVGPGPGFPPLKDGWHYEVCGRVIAPSELTPADRLQGICDMTNDVDADLRAQKEQNKKLHEDMKAIRSWACDPPKTK